MRGTLSILILLAGCSAQLLPHTVPIIAAEATASIYLIGDAGAPAPGGEPVLIALRQLLDAGPDSSLVVFLGDNVYPRGLPDSLDRHFPEASRRLRAQLAIGGTRPERLIFVPGNHDWDKSGPDGWNRIRWQGAWLERESGGRARLLPAEGCPGPVVVDVAGGLRLILLDTEWWLFGHDRPGIGSSCPARTPDEVSASLAGAIRGHRAVVAAHHPLATGGEHGGYFNVMDHLFPLRAIHPALLVPLPVVGSVYPIARGAGISDEDLSGGRNRVMRAALDSVFACDPPVLYASGHEHGLQLIDRGHPPLLAVSGAGIFGHASFVTGIPGARLALSQAGFMRLDLLPSGRLRLGVFTVTRDGHPNEVHSELLPAQQERGTGSCITPT